MSELSVSTIIELKTNAKYNKKTKAAVNSPSRRLWTSNDIFIDCFIL